MLCSRGMLSSHSKTAATHQQRAHQQTTGNTEHTHTHTAGTAESDNRSCNSKTAQQQHGNNTGTQQPGSSGPLPARIHPYPWPGGTGEVIGPSPRVLGSPPSQDTPAPLARGCGGGLWVLTQGPRVPSPLRHRARTRSKPTQWRPAKQQHAHKSHTTATKHRKPPQKNLSNSS